MRVFKEIPSHHERHKRARTNTLWHHTYATRDPSYRVEQQMAAVFLTHLCLRSRQREKQQLI